MNALQINLFGHVSVVHPNSSAPLHFSRASQALLAYLLLRQHLVPRDVLMDVFWVDIPPEQARSCLATALWRLRRLLEPDDIVPGTYLITRNTGEVGFNWDSEHWLDTESFEIEVNPLLQKPQSEWREDELKKIEAVLTLYRGELLEGIYDDWALRERERFRLLHLSCLKCLMESYTGQSKYEQSIAVGHEILRRDPVREDIHRAMMRLYQENGQRTQAIRQYSQCTDLLRQEFDVAPLEETQMLFQQIRESSRDSAATVPAAPINADVTDLLYELQEIKKTIDLAARTLAQMQATVSQYANNPANRASGEVR